MLTLFNRRELAAFSSQEERRAACQLLQDSGISYQLRTATACPPPPAIWPGETV